MPARSRVHAEAFTVSAARNYWEFPAPPIEAEIVRTIGSAINHRHLVRVDYTGDAEPATLTLEPHDLVVWAARWYLVAFDPDGDRWRAMRVDRITPRMPTHSLFDRRDIPHGDPVSFVMTTHDRGDAAAEWQCRGSAILALPAAVVARYAPGGSTVEYDTDSSCRLTPGGSTVEYDTDSSCRLTLGAWSWAGLAGLLLTFDADLTDIEPLELTVALKSLPTRIGRCLSDAQSPVQSTAI